MSYYYIVQIVLDLLWIWIIHTETILGHLRKERIRGRTFSKKNCSCLFWFTRWQHWRAIVPITKLLWFKMLYCNCYCALLNVACSCNLFGSEREDCEQTTGQCVCKHHVTGRKCDMCANGRHIGPHGCTSKSLLFYCRLSVFYEQIISLIQ